jgi:hypothetical protein
VTSIRSTQKQLFQPKQGETMHDIKRTARLAGLSYLGLALTGVLGFLLVRANLYVDGDSAQTLVNLTERESLARLGIALEFGIVISQALAALYFFKLFRGVNSFAAGALATFGMVNAIVILVGTLFASTALSVAHDPTGAPGGDQAATVQLLFDLSNGAWHVGGLFFGLWLIPMGYIVYSAEVMPRVLGLLLIAGGVGYLLSTFGSALLPDVSVAVVESPSYVATIAEFWMIGYLLIFGIRTDKAITPAHLSSAETAHAR